MSKSNKIVLFDENDVKAFDISSVSGKTTLTADHIKVSGKFNHVHAGNAAHSFDDFNKLVKDEDTVHTTVTATLDAGIVSTEGKISTEGINYLAHKATVSTAITNETTRATGVTDGLTVDKNTMVSDREAQQTQLDSDIQQMIALRETAITDYATEGQQLVTNMSTEYQAYDALIGTRIDTLMSLDNPDFDKDTLLAIVNEFQNADAAQIAELTQLQSDFDDLKLRIDETIVQEAAGGGGGATYDMKVLGTYYNNSVTYLMMNYENAVYPDSLAMLDDLVVGDQIKIEIPSSQQEEILTFNGITDITNNYRYKVNFVEYISNSYFNANIIVTKL